MNNTQKIASMMWTVIAILFCFSNAEIANAAVKAKKFYLTQDSFTGSQALTACEKGFHMASLWEVLDVTSLEYDTDRGFTQDDSGDGPPSKVSGWIRTGMPNNNATQIPGWDNCNGYTTDTGTGTVIMLNPSWAAMPTNISNPWTPGGPVSDCQFPWPVWCVQDNKPSLCK